MKDFENMPKLQKGRQVDPTLQIVESTHEWISRGNHNPVAIHTIFIDVHLNACI